MIEHSTGFQPNTPHFTSFFDFPHFYIFVFGGISGLYDLVNKSCLKQRKKNPGNETHIAFFLMAVPGE